MTEPENIVLLHLRKLDTKLDGVISRLDRVELRLNEVADHMTAFMQSSSRQDKTLSELASRIDRIERRLELGD